MKEWEQMANLAIPLSPSILQDFERKIELAYHVTDLKGFKNLVKLQGKRKDVSTFTRGSVGISNGAMSGGTLLVQLHGKSSFYSKMDFMSKLDRNGNRWIGKYGDVDRGSENNKFSVIYNEFSKLMGDKIEDKYPVDSSDDMWYFVSDHMSGKEKAEFIGWYYDEAKKIISSKFLKKVQKNMSKLTGASGGDYNNDELFLHDFKILQVDIIDKYEEGEEAALKEYEKEYDQLRSHGWEPKLILKSDIENIK